ncbi:MAG: 3'-5' exonuclease [Epsilonproteobacteria bacterium]|nr:3'-5' exonuclease [Campylobacterota bacterium]
MFGKFFYKRALKDKEFYFLLEKYEGDEVIALDCETTGLDVLKDEILTIAALKIKKNRIFLGSSFEAKIEPTNKIDAKSVEFHLLRDCDLKGARKPKEAILELLRFIRNRPIVGYYIEFDKKIISRYTKELIGIPLLNSTIELSSLYHKKYYSPFYGDVDLSFDAILKRLDIPNLGQHDALNDALMSALIYLKLQYS